MDDTLAATPRGTPGGEAAPNKEQATSTEWPAASSKDGADGNLESELQLLNKLII